MFGRKHTLVYALSGLLLSLQLALSICFAAVSVSAHITRPAYPKSCTATSQTILLYPIANSDVQCLEQNGTYTLGAGGSVCNFSLTKILLVPLHSTDSRYGSGYLEHGWCQQGTTGGLSFQVISLPIVQDQTTCQANGGVFVRSKPVAGTIVLQCLQAGGIYQIHDIRTVCNFTASSVVTIGETQKRTLTSDSACFTKKKSTGTVYNGLLLARKPI